MLSYHWCIRAEQHATGHGYIDYLKLVNAQGGINGVTITFEECETGYATDRGVECYERLKGEANRSNAISPLRASHSHSPTRQSPTRFR